MQKILVVDDAEINRELLREFLEADYVVETAENGEQAMGKLHVLHDEISALLLDLHMPRGDGFAVIPKNGKVVSPISGVAESVFPTGHAIGIRSKENIECIIHVGLDTVNLNGKGFKSLIHQGDKVKAGQPVIEFDKEFVEEKGYNTTTMVVFPSGYEHTFTLDEKEFTAGEIITL